MESAFPANSTVPPVAEKLAGLKFLLTRIVPPLALLVPLPTNSCTTREPPLCVKLPLLLNPAVPEAVRLPPRIPRDPPALMLSIAIAAFWPATILG